MKNLTIILSLVFLISCANDNANSENVVTVEELIASIDSKKYENQKVKIKGKISFIQSVYDCAAVPCKRENIENYALDDTYIYKNVYKPCPSTSEIVFTDDEISKISIGNFPIYKYSEDIDLSDLYKIEGEIQNIEVSAKVIYDEKYNYCKETKHQSISIEIDEQILEEFVNSIEDIVIVE